MNNELENFINKNRNAFDQRTPDPAVLEKIQQQMQAGSKKKPQTIVLPMRVVKWAAACCILLAGAAIFWLVQKEPVQKITAKAVTETQVTVPAATETSPETAAIEQPVKKDLPETEPSSEKQVLFAKLNDMGSTSRRLDATAAFDRITNTDHDIVDALVKTMNTDPSTNVRLAALDALGKFSKETYVKKKLVASLEKQKDPMVQISLIELLTRMRESSILKELDKLVSDGNTMDAVKDRAYSSIFKLRAS